VDFTAAWAANFAASLTLSLLGLVARGPALAEHRPRLPGRAGRLRLQPAARGDRSGLRDRNRRGGLVPRARGGVRQAFAARTRATRRAAPAWTPVWSFRRA